MYSRIQKELGVGIGWGYSFVYLHEILRFIWGLLRPYWAHGIYIGVASATHRWTTLQSKFQVRSPGVGPRYLVSLEGFGRV